MNSSRGKYFIKIVHTLYTPHLILSILPPVFYM